MTYKFTSKDLRTAARQAVTVSLSAVDNDIREAMLKLAQRIQSDAERLDKMVGPVCAVSSEAKAPRGL